MELLRQLGMRPTDVRRVVRKAPEVLAPRPDGSTAAEAVDVSLPPDDRGRGNSRSSSSSSSGKGSSGAVIFG